MNKTLLRFVKITRGHIKNTTDIKETLSIEVIYVWCPLLFSLFDLWISIYANSKKNSGKRSPSFVKTCEDNLLPY